MTKLGNLGTFKKNLYFGGRIFYVLVHIFFYLLFCLKIAVICNAYIFHLPPCKVKQTKKWINTDLFTKDQTYILGCMVQNMVFFRIIFCARESFFSQSKLREDKYMSWFTSKLDKNMNWNFLHRYCGPL